MRSVSPKKYQSVYYAIYENLKNIGNLKKYFIDNSETSIFFHFPHGYSHTRSYVEVYKEGNLTYNHTFYKVPYESNVFKLLLYYCYFQYILFRYVPRGSYILTDNPVFCVGNEVGKILKQAKFIYWIGDYYPDNRGFMKIYNALSQYYNKSLRIVWYVSPMVMKMYRVTGVNKSPNKIRMLVSLGTQKKAVISKKHANKNITLGFIGVIREQQGLDLVFSYLKKYKKAKLEIVGSGYKLDLYKQLADKMKIKNRVKFYGYVENMDKVVHSWDIGVALYENSKSNVSIYCEPTKIKNYLEYCLPVITTRSTYFYKELEKEKAGEAISETVESLDSAINRIVAQYSSYKKGVEVLLERYEYKKYYDVRLKFMQKSRKSVLPIP